MPSAIKAAQLVDQIRDYIALWLLKDFPGFVVSVDQVTLKPNMLVATVWLVLAEGATVSRKEIISKSKLYQQRLASQFSRRTIPRIEFKFIENIENSDIEK